MQTFSGRSVWPTGHAPTPEEEGGWPSDSDIGVSLGRIPRFAGHTRHHIAYPVLAHVLVVAALVPDSAKAYALLHDAPESCVSDTPTPWKTEAAEQREDTLLHRLTLAWGLPWPWPDHIREVIKLVDYEAQKAEVIVLDHPNPSHWPAPDEQALAQTQHMFEAHALSLSIPSVGQKAFATAAAKWRPLADGYDASKDLTLLDEYVPVDISDHEQDDHSHARWNPRHVRR